MTKRKHAQKNQGESESTVNFNLAYDKETSQIRVNVSLSQSCSNGLRTTGNEGLSNGRECKCCSPTSCSTNFGLSAKSTIDDIGPEVSNSPHVSREKKGKCECANSVRAAGSITPTDHAEGSEQSVSLAINVRLKVGGKSDRWACSPHDSEDSWMEQPNQLSYLAETVSTFLPESPQPPQLTVPYQRVPVASDHTSSKPAIQNGHLGETECKGICTLFYPTDQVSQEQNDIKRKAYQIVKDTVANAVNILKSTPKTHSGLEQKAIALGKTLTKSAIQPVVPSQTEGSQSLPAIQETDACNLNIPTNSLNLQQYTDEAGIQSVDMENNTEGQFWQASKLVNSIILAAKDRLHFEGQPEKQAHTEGGSYLHCILSKTKDQPSNILPASADTDHSHELVLQQEGLPIQRESLEDISGHLPNAILSVEPTDAVSGVGENVREDDEQKFESVLGQPVWKPQVDLIGPNTDQQPKLEPSSSHITMVNLQINTGKTLSKESRQALDEDPSFTSLEVHMGSRDENGEKSSVSSLTEKIKYVFVPVDRTGLEERPPLLRQSTPMPTEDDLFPPPDILIADENDLNRKTVFSLSPENLANKDLPTTSARTDDNNIEVPASLHESFVNEVITDNVEYIPRHDPLFVNEPHDVDLVDESKIAVFNQEKVISENDNPLQLTNIGTGVVELAPRGNLPLFAIENDGISNMADLELSVQPSKVLPTTQTDNLVRFNPVKIIDMGESSQQEEVLRGKPVAMEEGHQAVEDTLDETMHGIVSHRELISDSNKVVHNDINIPQLLPSSNSQHQLSEEVEQPKEVTIDGLQSPNVSESGPSMIDVMKQGTAEQSPRSPILQDPVCLKSGSPFNIICEENGAQTDEVVALSLGGSPLHSDQISKVRPTAPAQPSDSLGTKTEVTPEGRQGVKASGIDITTTDNARKRVSAQSNSENSVQPNGPNINLDTNKYISSMQMVSRRDDPNGCTCCETSQMSQINLEICLKMCSSCICSSSSGLSPKYMKPPPPPPPDCYFDDFPENIQDLLPGGANGFPNNNSSPKTGNGMSDSASHGRYGTADMHQTSRCVAVDRCKLVQRDSDRPNVLADSKGASISSQRPVSPVSETSLSTTFQQISNSLIRQTTQPACSINNLSFGDLVESDQPKSFVQWAGAQVSYDLQFETSRGSVFSACASETRGRLHHEKAHRFHVIEIPVLPKYGFNLFGNPIGILGLNYDIECHGSTPDSELRTKISPTRMSSTCAPVLGQLAPVVCSDSVSPPLTEANETSNSRTPEMKASTVVNSRYSTDLLVTRNGECLPTDLSHVSNRLPDTIQIGDFMTRNTENIHQDIPYSVMQDSASNESLTSLTGAHEQSIAKFRDYHPHSQNSPLGADRRRLTRDDKKNLPETDSASYTSVSVIDEFTSRRVNTTPGDANGLYGAFRPHETEFNPSRISNSDLPVLPSPVGTVDYLRQFRNHSLGLDNIDHNPTMGLFQQNTTQPDDIMTDLSRYSFGSLRYSQTKESQEDISFLKKQSGSGELASLLLRQATNPDSLRHVRRSRESCEYNTKDCGAGLKEDDSFNRTSVRDTLKTRRYSYQSCSLPRFHGSAMQTSTFGDMNNRGNHLKRRSNRSKMESLDCIRKGSFGYTATQPFRRGSQMSNTPHHQRSTISQLLKQRHSLCHCMCCHDNNEGCICWFDCSSRNLTCRKRRLSLSSSRYRCRRPRRESLLIQGLNLCSNPTNDSGRYVHFAREAPDHHARPVFMRIPPTVGGGDPQNGPATLPWDHTLTNPSMFHVDERTMGCLPTSQCKERQQCFCKCHCKPESAIF